MKSKRETLRPLFSLVVALSFVVQFLSSCAESRWTTTIPIVAFIESSTSSQGCNEPAAGIQAFKERLQELGYVIGQTVVVERRCSERLNEFLEASSRKAHVVISVSNDADMATHGTIQINTVRGLNVPIHMGTFSSLGRPSFIVPWPPSHVDADRRRLRLLKSIVPDATRFAVLTEHGVPVARRDWGATAQGLDLHLLTLDIRTGEELDSAFVRMRRERIEAAVFRDGTLLLTDHRRVMQRIADKRLPTAFSLSRFADEGGLMSFGVDITDLYRRLAGRVDELLHGADAAGFPMETPKLQLVINLKTARTLGLTIPPPLLRQADHVIE